MSSTGRSDARSAAKHPRDLFQTPPSALRPLLRSGVVQLDGTVWEPCAGGGMMVRTLIEHGVQPGAIIASDLQLAGQMPDGVDVFDGVDLTTSISVIANRLHGNREEPRFGTPPHAPLTVITNPPYRVPRERAGGSMQGMRGDLLDMMIPKAPTTKVTGVRREWRDGIAATFHAAASMGAMQIVLGPIRIGWWAGGACRTRLRRFITTTWSVRLMSMAKRPRFLQADGAPTSGNDSCEYVFAVFDRKPPGTAFKGRTAATIIELGGDDA